MKDLVFFPAKRIIIPLFAAILAVPAGPLRAEKVPLLTQAQHEYARGDYASAKEKFELVLASNPKNVVAKNYLKMIAVAEAQAGPGARMEVQLKRLVMPKVEIREATLDSALEYLRQQAIKVSGEKLKPNFVLQPGVDASKTVTLRLNDIPFTEVLRYVGELASVQFTVEQYAISVKPKPSPTSAATTAPEASEVPRATPQ